jgi:hypothetical protein
MDVDSVYGCLNIMLLCTGLPPGKFDQHSLAAQSIAGTVKLSESRDGSVYDRES